MKKLTYESRMVPYRYYFIGLASFALFLLLFLGLHLMLFKLFPEAKLSLWNSSYLY
jgi:hypothetical protein